MHGLTVDAARQHHRAFGGQWQALLQYANHGRVGVLQLRKSSGQLRAVVHPRLPFAVVAQPCGFQNTGQQIVLHLCEFRRVMNHPVRRYRHTAAHEMCFLQGPVLRNPHG